MAVQTFTYPGKGAEGGRAIREGGTSYHMCRSESLNSKVLVIEPGVHNSAHAHADEDAHYYVLAGQVRFHGADDEVVELGAREGLLMPANTSYWFESCGDDTLEMLRVSRPASKGGAT